MFIAIPRRLIVVFVLTIILIITFTYRESIPQQPWRSLPLEKIGLGEIEEGAQGPAENGTATPIEGDTTPSPGEATTPAGAGKEVKPFPGGKAKPAGHKYTKNLIIASIKKEDTAWLDETFPPGSHVNVSKYVADDPSAPLHPLKNKGHEVMVYLTHIIDFYDSLSDVNIFMHAHRRAWHNDDLMDWHADEMVNRLSAERVQREGFMNMRCHWNPGCPDWMHPGASHKDVNKKEEVVLARAWAELFPDNDVPSVLAQPCCAQFAVSADRIRMLPKEKYMFFRDWILKTPLDDYISGRVWEYVWHYVFTRRAVLCPEEHICYCDGFGICFGGKVEYDAWWDKKHDLDNREDQLREWEEQAKKIKDAEKNPGGVEEGVELKIPEYGRDVELRKEIGELKTWTTEELEKAKKRGDLASSRAKEAGRNWQPGDGF
jgi:hypothetical protein